MTTPDRAYDRDSMLEGARALNAAIQRDRERADQRDGMSSPAFALPQLVAEFSVAGIPRPQGSMRAFAHKTTGRIVVMADSKKTAPWKQAVAEAARGGKLLVWGGPVAVGITFRLPRPKGHLGKSGLLPSAPHHPQVKPDIDKLARAVLDALVEAGVIVDDALVVRLAARKVYGEPGASVRVLAEPAP